MLDKIVNGFWIQCLNPTFITGTLLLHLVALGIYRCYFHPLAKYPGPLAAKLSGLYMLYFVLTAQSSYIRHDLHQKYGPIVRSGPNEILFSDAAAIKDIYCTTTNHCPKALKFYQGFTLTGTESVFSTTDRAVHARMRRLLANGFSQNGVLQFEPEIAELVQRYLDIIGNSTSQPVEFHDITNFLFLDVISTLAFAKCFDLLSGKYNQGVVDIQTYFEICPAFGLAPWARYLPFGIFRAARESQPRIINATQTWIDEFRDRLKAGSSERGLLRAMTEAKDTETNSMLSDPELIENGVIFVLGGAGTSGTALLYMLYELGKRPEMQRRLEKEIREAFPDPSVMPDYKTATKLPYLECVYQEALRLRGPINTTPLRTSPGKYIAGEYVPSGITIGSNAYTTHRDPAVFPGPEKFEPSRWENVTPEMTTMQRPFMVGPRNCIGMHLARVQIFITVCALYQRFDMSVDPSITPGMMEMRDLGLMSPWGKSLKMQVLRRGVKVQ